MSALYLVADDLTGALDTAASFCQTFGPIPVYLGMPRDQVGPHAAVDLATRDADAAFAVRANLSVVRPLAAADIAFKKIDSLLRGHWAIELAALLRSGLFRSCVMAPAFPGQGRTTVRGRQVVSASGASSYTVEVDPAERLRQLNLTVTSASGLGSTGYCERADSDLAVVLADAATDEELRAIVRWGARLPRPILWCGSAGLARAMAPGDLRQFGAIQRPVLAIVGTDHAVSREQVAHAASRIPACLVVVGTDVDECNARVAQAIAQTGSCVLTFALPSDASADAAAASIRERLTTLLRRMARPSTLLVMGGETLLSVCRALGATHLEVDGELSPGVPHSRLCAGLWPGVDVVSKSGAFGSPDWLDRLLTADD